VRLGLVEDAAPSKEFGGGDLDDMIEEHLGAMVHPLFDYRLQGSDAWNVVVAPAGYRLSLLDVRIGDRQQPPVFAEVRSSMDALPVLRRAALLASRR